MIDYGYVKPNNQNTLQSVIKHKKNRLLKNLGKADITSHVNFSLLKNFLKKFKSQRNCYKAIFKKNGIIERAEIVSKNDF